MNEIDYFNCITNYLLIWIESCFVCICATSLKMQKEI